MLNSIEDTSGDVYGTNFIDTRTAYKLICRSGFYKVLLDCRGALRDDSPKFLAEREKTGYAHNEVTGKC